MRGWIIASLLWIGAVVWYNNAINALIYPIETFRDDLFIQMLRGARYNESQIATALRARELYLLTVEALIPSIVVLLAGLGIIWAMRRLQTDEGTPGKPN